MSDDEWQEFLQILRRALLVIVRWIESKFAFEKERESRESLHKRKE